MSSLLKGLQIIVEKNECERNDLVDKLNEKDAKKLLKICLNYVVPKDPPISELVPPSKDKSKPKKRKKGISDFTAEDMAPN